jgi:hypothetical protein
VSLNAVVFSRTDVAVLKQELGMAVPELIRKVGIGEQTFYRWYTDVLRADRHGDLRIYKFAEGHADLHHPERPRVMLGSTTRLRRAP